MNTAQTLTRLCKGVAALVELAPKPKPPRIDYMQIEGFMPKYSEMVKGMATPEPQITGVAAVGVSYPPEIEEEAPVVRNTVTITPVEPERKVLATSCIACSQSHITGIAGALDEGLRFAREGGVTDPEALRRIDAAEREIVTMERIDLSPEAILNSPEKDQELARYFLPKIRVLRQDIGQIADVPGLEKAAAEASVLSQEFRLKRMQAAGVNLNPIMALAKAVQDGTMTVEEARAKVKEFLPEGV